MSCHILFKGEYIMLTKGQMIKELKKNGIRKGNKGTTEVSLEHLKTSQIITLYSKYCDNKTK